MLAEAKINREWAVRLIAIGVLFTAFGAWFVYDGAIAWPRHVEHYKLAYEIPEGADQSQAKLRDDWRERFEEAGLAPPDNPKDLKHHSPMDITMQFVYAAVCIPIGLLSLLWLGINARRRLYADEQGVVFGSRRVNYEQVSDIDYGRWDSKGIAVLETADNKLLTLDDWKFKGADGVLAAVEQKTGRTRPTPARKQSTQASANEPPPTEAPMEPTKRE